MKLAYPELTAVFETGKGYIPTLVIENRCLMRKILCDIAEQLNGNQGLTVVSDGDEPLEISRYVELLQNFTPFSMNQKPLITKIISLIEKKAQEPENFMRTQALVQRMEAWILDMGQELPCEIECTKMSVGSILKAAGIEIVSDQQFPLEQLVEYMELVRDLEREKLFVLVNIRSYYDDQEITVLLRTLLDHALHVMLLDSYAGNVLVGEKRWTVDEDLCEF